MKARYHFPAMAALVLALSGVGAQSAARADFQYRVVVDTTSLRGTEGSLDFQFNPAAAGNALPITAKISNFALTGGTLASTSSRTGNTTGSLPGSLTLLNGSATNEFQADLTFGRSFSFDTTLTGAGVNNPSPGFLGSVFTLSLQDLGFSPKLTTDPAGSVLSIALRPNGSSVVSTFASGPNGLPSVVTVSAVPEPASCLLLGLGMAGLVASGIGRRRVGVARV